VAGEEQCDVLTATENGYGKRTPIVEYTRHGRGGQGIIAIDTSERNGRVVGAQLITEDDEIMLITSGGVLIRTRVKEIRQMGRATQGVTLINLDDGERLTGLEKIVEADEAEGETGNGANGANGAGGAHGAGGANGADGANGAAGPDATG